MFLKKRFIRAVLIGLTTTFLVTACGSDSNSEKVTTPTEKSESTEKPAEKVVQSLGEHWIKDANNVYLFNPKPIAGESIEWSGNFVQDGDYKFADGEGKITWYLNGEIEQIDEGTFKHGQRDGNFRHEFFPGGSVAYTKWDNGVEIPDVVADDNDDVSAAKKAFINYHKAITNKDYRAAYETLSYKQRERVGDFDSWVKGYADTISSEVSNMTLKNSEDNAYTFDYTLTARDRHNDGTKVQVFEGQVTMAKDKGKWYVRFAKSSRVDEKIIAERENEERTRLDNEQKIRQEKLANTSAAKDLAKETANFDTSTKNYLERLQPFALSNMLKGATGIMGFFSDRKNSSDVNYAQAMSLLAGNEYSRGTEISRDVAKYFEYEAKITSAYIVRKESDKIFDTVIVEGIILNWEHERDEVENRIRTTAKDCGAELSSYVSTEPLKRIVEIVKDL
ncbi:MAG: hypothetical protein IJS81_08250 [Selenomonadaceae bacterium]|nr:hypothetical protein [Selenomonadaceae bacterium]